MLKKISLILLLISGLQAIGQEELVLSGKVVDNNTKEPLSFSTIIYQNKYIGTTSDKNGDFSFTLNKYKESDSIIISYLGYKPFKRSISECKQLKTFKLTPLINQLEEVIVFAKKPKLNLKLFIKNVITDYNKNKKKDSHIAIAHYREKAKENDKYIMYMESIGYTVFAGKRFNAAPLSNYKFFCENTKAHVINPDWVKYRRHTKSSISPSGSSNLNVFRSLEIDGLLSKRHYKKYTYKIDSTYFVGNKPVYSIKFKGKISKGALHVFKNTKQILKIECTTDKYPSSAFHKRVEAQVTIQFNYFNNMPFISSITSNYKHKGLEHTNSLNILVQKFNDFKLNSDEYWSLNNYSVNPYIKYYPEEWEAYNISIDSDYKKIETDLSSTYTSLEQQFFNYSERWFILNENNYKPIMLKVRELKTNF